MKSPALSRYAGRNLRNFAHATFSICALAALALCSSHGQESATGIQSNQPATSPSVKEEANTAKTDSESAKATKAGATPKTEIATFGGGCFWCTEAVIERVEGVIDVVSGYMGGHVENPTYEQVCEKNTGHVEVIQVTFDPKKITFEELLDIFWQAHDPTTWDQQGADKGPQYRSAIFAHSPEQKLQAENSKRQLNESGKLASPAVTEIRDAAKFWVAEDYHQDYFKNNPTNGYCRAVIIPKLQKLGLE
jgi:peptide-methionine (S)-S-oxide reductase